MASLGTWCMIKNEIAWIRPHLFSWLPFVKQMVFLDGNSTDGTLEVIKDVQNNHPFGKRITLIEDRDCKNLTDHYVDIANEAIRAVDADFAMFLHPDMMLDNPSEMVALGDAHCYWANMRSFAGEPGGQLYEIVEGRGKRWKNIMRRKNPDLGLHYAGYYGAVEEDMYFSQITGEEHVWHKDFEDYPYEIKDSGIKIWHFSDVRLLKRRIGRMVSCLINQGNTEEIAEIMAPMHPRVNFKDGYGFKFLPVDTPDYLKPELIEAINV